MGKVQREWLRPMAFFEFLDVLGETPLRDALSAAAVATTQPSPAIEVKAGVNTKAKSIQTYRQAYRPEKAILFSGLGINQLAQGLLHAPLYLAGAVIP